MQQKSCRPKKCRKLKLCPLLRLLGKSFRQITFPKWIFCPYLLSTLCSQVVFHNLSHFSRDGKRAGWKVPPPPPQSHTEKREGRGATVHKYSSLGATVHKLDRKYQQWVNVSPVYKICRMPQSLLAGQLKEKPTYRVWCLYSSFVHGVTSHKEMSSILTGQ